MPNPPPSRPSVWLTRPQADSARLAARLAAHGIHSLVAPLTQIVPLVVADAWPAAEVILLTSRHGAASLAAAPAQVRALPAYCVGEATAEAAREAGVRPEAVGREGVLPLLARMRESLRAGTRVLYPCGTELRHPVAMLLPQMTVLPRIVYDAQPLAALPEAVADAASFAQLRGVAVFSPRAGQLLQARLAAAALSAAQLRAYCLSLEVAQALAGCGCERLLVAAAPEFNAMVDLIVSDHAGMV